MERDEKIVRDFLDGMPLRAIGTKYKLSYQRVHQILKRENIDQRKYGGHLKAMRLREKEVQEILKKYKPGDGVKELSKKTGKSPTRISELRGFFNIQSTKYAISDTKHYCSVCGKIDDISNFRVKKNGYGFTTYVHRPCGITTYSELKRFCDLLAPIPDRLPEWMNRADFVLTFGILPNNFRRLINAGYMERKHVSGNIYLYNTVITKQAIKDGKITCAYRKVR